MSAGLRAASVMLIAENTEAWSLIRNHSRTMPMLYKNVAECLFCRALTAVAAYLNGGQQMPSTCYTPLTLVGDITMDALTQRIARGILTTQLASLALPLDSLRTNFATDRHATALYMSLGAMFGIDVQTSPRARGCRAWHARPHGGGDLANTGLRSRLCLLCLPKQATPQRDPPDQCSRFSQDDFSRELPRSPTVRTHTLPTGANTHTAYWCEHTHCLLVRTHTLPILFLLPP